MTIIPAIDIKNGKCVRLTQGIFETEKIYSDDPIAIAKQWEQKGAKMLHLVDLDGAQQGKLTNLKTIKKIIKKIKIPIQIGGGIRTESTINTLLSLGIKRVILGTIALENKKLLQKLLNKYPSQIVIALDTQNGKLLTRGWLNPTNKNYLLTALELEQIGVKRFIYTDTTKDGTLTQPNFKQIATLTQNLTIPLLVAGGISTPAHLKTLSSLQVEAAIIGKALYENKLDLSFQRTLESRRYK